MVNVTLGEAKDKIGQLLETAQHEPVAILRHGVPAAFLVSPEEMEELLESRRIREQAVDELKTWSGRTASRATPASAALSDEDVSRLVHESR
jgi:antitoxin Phd